MQNFGVAKLYTHVQWTVLEGSRKPHLTISEFMLNEMLQRNASKFAKFFGIRKPKYFFPFFILSYFGFVTMDVLVYDIDQGIDCNKSKVARNEK